MILLKRDVGLAEETGTPVAVNARSIEATIATFVKTFAILDDWNDRYRYLSPSRGNGLYALVQFIRRFAMAEA